LRVIGLCYIRARCNIRVPQLQASKGGRMAQTVEEIYLTVRVPVQLLPTIAHLAARMNLPRRTVAQMLMEQGIREPAPWMRELLAELEPVSA
jgi:hypothetical protein